MIKTTPRRIRRDFSRIKKVVDIPNLIELQKASFKQFIQAEVAPNERTDTGLQGVFKSSFPIKDFNQTASLEFVSYALDEPKYDVIECRSRGMTFAAPMRVVVRLIIWDNNEQTGVPSIRDVKEQEVYFGEIPLMTENGTFIINGTERVIVSQLHRSPGIFFEHDKGKTHASGKLLYSARVIPYRGSWLDFEFDSKDFLFVRIDRRRKLPVTVLLRALGNSVEDLLNYFYKSEKFSWEGKKTWKSFVPEVLIYQKASTDIKDPSTGEALVKKGRKFTRLAIEKLKKVKVSEIPVELDDFVTKDANLQRVLAHDVVNPATGEILAGVNEKFTPDMFDKLKEAKVSSVDLLYIDGLNVGGYLRETLLHDKVNSPEEAIMEIYKRLRPGDPVSIEPATRFFENLFFNPELYDLSKVGRLKINYKFGFDVPLEVGILRKEDIFAVVRYILDLKDGNGEVDDIDHLGNRRVRPVGELLENQFRVGLARMERSIRERMSLTEVDTLMPHDLVNAKPVMAVVKEFFSSSQLSQFMDQTNPLSEITHKRRLSALGPGGLTRDRAGFEVRDVHFTHYGRICPIETPEGPNIGLIASLSSHARVNDYGFIETPYRRVVNGRVTDEVVYCSALEEEKYVIAQANAPLNTKGEFTTDLVQCRKKGEYILVKAEEVQLMDVSPNQLVSIAASLVPFLENDDANRALMGSNMERQAVPLMRSTAPLIGTKIEPVVARDSGVAVISKNDGTVLSVDATKIIVKPDKVRSETKKKKKGSDLDQYLLTKYQRSNQGTCMNQMPIVHPGEKVKAGDIIADGPATDMGELALGQNMLVAFMPWGGYNFEDSILISERVVKDDSFTSIHIEEFECVARDTKLGKEDITRDIPNVAEEALANLDEGGIIRIGAEVKPGDILVGKITPKGETQLSPEEKLLRAIFGEKAGDVKDSSLRVPPGIAGIVIGAQTFSREGIDLESESEPADEETSKLKKELEEELKKIREVAAKRMRTLLIGKTSSSKVMSDDEENVLLASGKKITESVLEKIPISKWSEISVSGGEDTEEEVAGILEGLEEQEDLVKMMYDQKITKLKKGDELPPGVIKIVKIFIAIKRKLQVGDKMAGRHGNKGVISRILPEEDMPYMADGRPVDVVLNPLGVPSRMNVGQILECHLGWAARSIGEQIQNVLDQKFDRESLVKAIKKAYKSETMDEFLEKANENQVKQLARSLRNGVFMDCPVFDGARESEIKECLKQGGLPEDGQTTLFDGKTGEPFSQPVTVGIMYMLKLHHLVEDKIHARSIGPYSLVTQQPLGGKAQFGGQRLGEMEVWAMEAYGAANALQEFLTVKSDDVIGRTRMYEAIVKGDLNLEPGLPESFNVLIKELQALCLDAELIETK